MRTRRRAARPVVGCALLVVATLGCTPAPEATSPPQPAASSPTADDGRGAARSEPPGPLAAALAGHPSRPSSAREAATRIQAAERAIGDPASTPRLLAAAGHTQQLAYQQLAEHPGWDRRVRARLPRRLRTLVHDNVAARREFRSMHPSAAADRATELPAWRIVRPLPAAELRRIYRRAERRFGVEWEYLAAINMVETAFGRIKGTSSAGAQGPMQFIPTTWEIYGGGGDIHDPRDAVMGAARMLRANGFDGDRGGALYRYNNHPAYVRGVTLLAEVMKRRPREFLGYHAWRVYYLTRRGSILLPEGYAERTPVPVRAWLRRHAASAG